MKIPPIDSGKANILNDCSDNSKKDTPISSLIQGDIAIQIEQKRDTYQGQQDIAYAFVKLKTRIWMGINGLTHLSHLCFLMVILNLPLVNPQRT